MPKASGRTPQFYSKICFAENDRGLGFFWSFFKVWKKYMANGSLGGCLLQIDNGNTYLLKVKGVQGWVQIDSLVTGTIKLIFLQCQIQVVSVQSLNQSSFSLHSLLSIPPLLLRTKVLLLRYSLAPTSFENLQAITPLVSNFISLLWWILSMLRGCIRSNSLFCFDQRSAK